MTSKRQKLVVVLGMHRSGTSAIAGLLAHLGAKFGDNLLPGAADNPTGFFEDAEVVALNDELLAELGVAWNFCRRIAWRAEQLESLYSRYGERAHALLQRISSDTPATHALKDPRLCRLLPFWQRVFARGATDIRYLWVIRSPIAVAQSLARRNCYSPDTACALWLRYNLDVLEFCAQSDAPVAPVDYDRILADEPGAAARFAADYDLLPPTAAYECFLAPDMSHAQPVSGGDCASDAPAVPDVQARAIRLHAALLRDEPAAFDIQAAEACIASRAAVLDHFVGLVDAALAREKSWLAQQAANLRQELDSLARENTALRGQHDALQEEALVLQQEATALQSETLALQSETLALQQETAALQGEVGALSRENARLNAQVEDIFSSRSWKLTRIYRFFGEKGYRVLRAPIYLKVYIHAFLSRSLYRISGFATSRSNQAAIHALAQDRGFVLASALDRVQARMPPLPDIDLVVVTHNSAGWLERFFSSLCKQRYPLSRISLFIVDNTSSDNTFDLLREHTAPIATLFRSLSIERHPNDGFGTGIHRGIARGSAEFILVSNVDLEFTEDAIYEVMTHALVDTDDVASWELRQQPYEHPKYYDPITLRTSWSSHACVVMRRDIYTRVGGYEKRIFLYGEDVELSYRFRRAGFHLKYVPSAVVNHYSYEHAESFKPLQFYGSTLANAYIRLRYGSARDILGLIGMHAALLLDGGPPQARRGLIFRNIVSIARNAPYFLSTRAPRPKHVHFPFRLWDYEMVRDGAFYSAPAVTAAMPRVSVVIRTYQGRENWLVEAISSVLNQTYRNIELIIVEDGSDSQRELAQRCMALCSGPRSIRYSAQPKRGRSFNGNAGLAAATGEFLMFLDDDDFLFCDHIETLARELLANTGIAASYALSWEVATDYDQGKGGGYTERMFATPAVLRQEFDREVLQHHNYIPIQSILFRRTLFERYGGFDIEMSQLEDWDLWFRYSRESEFKHVPKTTSMYRTPYNAAERASRHQLLHESYDHAKGKQAAFLQALTRGRTASRNKTPLEA